MGEAEGDPNDPGWGDIAFFVSPMLAALIGLLTGLMLALVAALRLVNVSLARARRALVVGMIGGPIIYLAVLIAVMAALDAAQSVSALAFVSFVVPALCGVGTTLVAALVPRSPADAHADMGRPDSLE
jgi:hypothetical protein